jgi:phosphoribosylaminoimidazolecarboxamide formyltransferase/IMP cyclohydrolase
VKRALLSCHDKTGLDGFAKELSALGIELIASGGTAEFLTARGLAVKTLEAFAGITEQLDGRVKTLHPKIHAGILARRDDPAHVQAVGSDGLIDLLVVNLYPFAQTIQRPGVSLQDAIEQIDVGGVALLRAAAKNFAHVAAVSSPQQYAAVAEALRKNRGTLPDAMSRQLATAAFQVTSGYDGAITQFLSSDGGTHQAANARAEAVFPDSATIQLRKQQTLRYGENPHQHGAWYVPAVGQAWGLGTLRHLQGKELSYNNLLDVDATVRCLLEFQDPTCAIIKHHAPCGVATAASLSDAYERAHACDAESAFGGVVGLNRPLDDPALAARLTEAFLEVIVAPAVAPQALERLGKKPNVRVVTVTWPSSGPGTAEWRQLLGSWLLQQPDREPGTEGAWPVATARSPSPTERRDLLFAWKAAKHALSNGIAIAKDQATVGLGQGQPSRVGSVRLAIRQAGERARGAVTASDGFFPFPDSVELLAQAGVTAVIQPGGSIRDADVIAAANRMNVAMVMTGVRHFRH